MHIYMVLYKLFNDVKLLMTLNIIIVECELLILIKIKFIGNLAAQMRGPPC
jgi:hypothetical protein